MSNPNIAPDQALATLYNFTRRAPLTADEHEAARQCALAIQEAVKPLEGAAAEKPKKS